MENHIDQTAGGFREGLTFDDVLLVPARSDVLPKDVSLATKLTREIDHALHLEPAAGCCRRSRSCSVTSPPWTTRRVCSRRRGRSWSRHIGSPS